MSNQYSGGLITKTPTTPNSISAPGVWTLSQQAAAQATNTWPFPRDPQFKNVTMLLQGNGSAGAAISGAGSSSSVIPFNADASTNNFNVAINGDAKSNNFTPYQGVGYYSSLLGTNGNYFTSGTNAALGLSTGDWTIEFFVYINQFVDNQFLIDFRPSGSGGATQPLIYLTTAGTLLYFTASATRITSSTGVVTLGAWTHIAVSRASGSTRMFVNGTQTGSTYTDSNDYGSSARFVNGTYGDAPGATNNNGGTISGHISNLRILKGTGLYTGSYTVPTSPLTAITNTSCLTHQSNRFIDNSGNNISITPSGSPSVSPAQPFTLPTTVATYGSGYFDGSGDYLNIASNAAFGYSTGDFSLEFWAYPSVSSDNNRVIFHTDDNFNLELINSGGSLLQFFSGSARTSTPYTYTVNAWNHCAITRQSGTARMFINGRLVNNFAFTSSKATSALNIATNGSVYFTGNLTDVRIVKGGIPSAYVTSSTTNGTQIFTPPTAPLSTSESLTAGSASLLTTQYNGGGNNSGFKDSSQFNFPITRNGNTTQGTFTPYAADWSNYFNGSSYFTIASNSVLNMNTYACLECWVNLSSSGTQQLIIGRDSSYWLAYDFSTIGGASTKFVFAIYNGSAWQAVSSSTTPAVGTWYHLVGIKDNTTLRIYINGTQENTATFSGTPATGATPFGIASNQNNTNMTGYISNARFNLGSTSTALPYTANFTSSALPLTAVTGTQLLTCQSNRFVDNSTNALTLSVSGTPSVQGFSPFAPLTVYNPTTYGGSAYFDGSGDYLTVPQNAAFNFGTGAFTVEAFIYITANNGTNERIIGLGDGVNASPGYYSGWTFNVNSSLTVLSFTRYDGTVYSYDATFTFNINTWYHVVAVRNSSSSFAMYINGTRVYNATVTTSFNNVNSNALNLAYQYDGAGGGGVKYFNGYISNARVVAGTAVYDPTLTTLTVPTAPLTAIANTSFLLSGTNPAILDNAMMNNLETVGNAAVSTSVKKYGAASMYFDGTGDYLSTVDNPSLDMGSANFTIEGWVYITSSGASQTFVAKGTGAGNQASYHIVFNGTNWLYYLSGNGSTWSIASGVTMGAGSVNNWQHLALVRNGSTFTPYVNGTAGTTTTSSTALFDSNKPFTVGADDAATQLLTGYIDDLRVTKGVARYTTAFTPPDQAFQLG